MRNTNAMTKGCKRTDCPFLIRDTYSFYVDCDGLKGFYWPAIWWGRHGVVSLEVCVSFRWKLFPLCIYFCFVRVPLFGTESNMKKNQMEASCQRLLVAPFCTKTQHNMYFLVSLHAIVFEEALQQFFDGKGLLHFFLYWGRKCEGTGWGQYEYLAYRCPM